ncbi:hypothetical protein SAMN05880593_108200 [Rhizobium sp. RU36D]|nr:hypothetical protein SAMN05880593_108200 [Rhizobium sp. RU36D]
MNIEESTSGGFASLIELDMDIRTFASDWSHCDRMSSYIARMVSHNRSDSLFYSNLFSSAFNELLETVFRTHGEDGNFLCRVARKGELDRIELSVPCSDEQISFYTTAVALINDGEVVERYRQMLFSEDALDPRIGLLELAVDYAAKISVVPTGDRMIKITIDLALEPREH